MKIINIEWENLTHHPDHQCDTFISYAEYEDGTPLTEEEIEALDPCYVHMLLIDFLY